MLYNEVIPSIFENLDDLYQDTFKLQYETNLQRQRIDTRDILESFRYQISQAVQALLVRDMTAFETRIKDLIVLSNHGLDYTSCRIGDSITGPYAVRLDICKRILQMIDIDLPLSLPSYNKPSYAFLCDYGDDKVKVQMWKIEFTKYHVVYYLRPNSYTENDKLCTMRGWEDIQSYNDVNKHILPSFMTYPDYIPCEVG